MTPSENASPSGDVSRRQAPVFKAMGIKIVKERMCQNKENRESHKILLPELSAKILSLGVGWHSLVFSLLELFKIF